MKITETEFALKDRTNTLEEAVIMDYRKCHYCGEDITDPSMIVAATYFKGPTMMHDLCYLRCRRDKFTKKKPKTRWKPDKFDKAILICQSRMITHGIILAFGMLILFRYVFQDGVSFQGESLAWIITALILAPFIVTGLILNSKKIKAYREFQKYYLRLKFEGPKVNE